MLIVQEVVITNVLGPGELLIALIVQSETFSLFQIPLVWAVLVPVIRSAHNRIAFRIATRITQ